MRARWAIAICVLVTVTALGRSSSHSAHVGHVSPDPCDSTSPQDLDGRLQSVFAVTVRQGQNWERKGTATLIDKSGIFVTAAHVVRDYKAKPIVLEQKLVPRISVELISPTDTPDGYDFVLLRAIESNWSKDAERDPYPMRLDDTKHQHAQFIGYEETKDQAVRRDVSFYRIDGLQHVYTGVLLGQSSGALLFDDAGRAFAVVVEHRVPGIVSVNNLHPEELFRAEDTRKMIPVVLLRQALPDLIKYIPPSPSIKDLIETLVAEVNVKLMPRNLSERASQIDVIHLTDAALLGIIAKKWMQVDRAQYRDLIERIEEAAQRACVKSRFLDDVVLLFKGD
jgi:hypothetical protein